MKRLVGDTAQLRLSALYEDYAVNDCCGDAALGYAIMNKTGKPLEALYPTFAGDELNGLKVNGDRWCIPLLALHRVTPEQMKSLWEWERTRPYNQVRGALLLILYSPAADCHFQHPFTHSTISDYLLSRVDLSTTRAEWDNYADRLQPEDSPAALSVSACASACAYEPSCLQYSYNEEQCKFGGFFQFGHSAPNTDYTSGWDMEKILGLGYQTDPDQTSSCKEATWLKPDIL